MHMRILPFVSIYLTKYTTNVERARIKCRECAKAVGQGAQNMRNKLSQKRHLVPLVAW